jgi:hypothetical protein
MNNFYISKERTIRTRMNTDEHGLKRKVCFAFGEKAHIAGRHFMYIWQGFRRRAVCTNLCLPRPLTPYVADWCERGGRVCANLPAPFNFEEQRSVFNQGVPKMLNNRNILKL